MGLADTLEQELKKGLLLWYDFKVNSHILYLGKAEDTLAQLLSQKAEVLICKSVEESIEAGWLETAKRSFDYIVSVADLEKIINPAEILEKWSGCLKQEGVLLLGMNNRYGIRYFCGDRDLYTNRNFDGIENYKRAYAKAADIFQGRTYSQAELRKILEKAGFEHSRFYSVYSDLQNPTFIYAPEYVPNEDMTCRVFPAYHHPSTVFLEEESLYTGLIENGMFHQMANAYFIECPLKGDFSNVLHVTSSMERGEENAVLTIIRENKTVEKRAAYPAGKKRLEKIVQHHKELASNDIRVVDTAMENDSCVMPYIDAPVGQLYLKELLKRDKEAFLSKMDYFRDLILRSSRIVEPDLGDGNGAVLEKGYLDFVPLNSFYLDGEFVFYDQEFCVENYPANILIWRMLGTFYASDMQVQKLIPMDELIDRYSLRKKLSKWQQAEWDFLRDLRKEKELCKYHGLHRRDGNQVNANRQRMNYSAEEYQRLFVDIFKNADTRKLILFGSGNFTKKFLAFYKKDYSIYAIVDNNESRWGQEMDGIKIQSPDILRQLQSGEYKVIICIKDYLSVMKQLDDMGVADYGIYDWNKDYPRKLKPITVTAKSEPEEAKKYHIGYVAGAFDMFHIGHLNLLRRAKEMCDYLIVGVISDETIRKIKNKQPVIPGRERVEVVAGCRYVDQAELLPTDYAGIRDAYKMFHFDCQFTGDDHGVDENWLSEQEYLKKQGADIVFFPYTKETSSTRIREKISKDRR